MWRLRRWTSIPLLMGAIVAFPAIAAAAPITLKFSGNWFYWDLGTSHPEQLALESGFDALGIVSGGCSSVGCYNSGTSLSLSLTLNPSASLSAPGGFGGASLDVGSISYSVAPSSLGAGSIFGTTRVTGPHVTGANGLTMVPVWMWLRVDKPLQDLLAAAPDPAAWHNSALFLSFRPRGYEATCPWPCSQGSMAVSQLTLVSVPDYSTLPLVCIGVAILFGTRRLIAARKVTQHT